MKKIKITYTIVAAALLLTVACKNNSHDTGSDATSSAPSEAEYGTPAQQRIGGEGVENAQTASDSVNAANSGNNSTGTSQSGTNSTNNQNSPNSTMPASGTSSTH